MRARTWRVTFVPNPLESGAMSLTIDFQITNADSPLLLALRPWANQLVNGGQIPIWNYHPESGIDFTQAPSLNLSFIGVDLDRWAQACFQRIDEVLSPNFRAAIQRVDQHQGTRYFEALSDSKKSLSDGLTNRLTFMMEGQTGPAAEIREAFWQQLLVELGNADTILAGVQYTTRMEANLLGLLGTGLALSSKAEVAFPILLSSSQVAHSPSGALLPFIDVDVVTYQQPPTDSPLLPSTQGLGIKLGCARIPILLRSAPTPPSLISHAGQASHSGPVSDIGKLMQWDYTIEYARDYHYPQDTLLFTVNSSFGPSLLPAEAGSEEIFEALAQFITIDPEIETVLRESFPKILASTAVQTDFDAADTALKSFHAMVERVVKAVQSNTPASTLPKPGPLSACLDGPVCARTGQFYWADQMSAPHSQHALRTTTESYHFELQESVGKSGAVDEVLVITIHGERPPAMGSPVVEIPGYITKPFPNSSQTEVSYCFEDHLGHPLLAKTGQAILQRKLTIPRLNILECQEVGASVEVKRNRDLIPGKSTASEFIYSGAEIRFASAAQPFLQWEQELHLEQIGDSLPRTATLQQHFTNLFNELMKDYTPNSLIIKLNLAYAYLADQPVEQAVLPVMMMPPRRIAIKAPCEAHDECSLAQMIDLWSEEIQKWFLEHPACPRDGNLQLDLVFYSPLTKSLQPMLRFSALKLGVKYIIDQSGGAKSSIKPSDIG